MVSCGFSSQAQDGRIAQEILPSYNCLKEAKGTRGEGDLEEDLEGH
jgi:hypothetical protein